MMSECRYLSAAFTPDSRALPVAPSLSFSLLQLGPPAAGGIA